MKKRFILLIFLFILICLISFIAYSNYTKEKRGTITGETVTGEVTDASLAISISVSGSPSLIIIKPENETYFTNESLDLKFTSTGADNFWYNIDQVTNITITGNTTFNTTEGPHTLYLYANNSNATVIKNMTFSVDLSKFRVLYNEYSGSTKGSSTDFNKSSYEDLQNLSGIILENTGWGKIEFNEVINSTNDSVPSDNLLDLDTNTNISENRIELNSTALPNFNKSATLYLYNLTLVSPVMILRDGSVCPSAICTQQSYTGGTLIFNVTQFTVYSAEETPVTVQPPGGGGGPVPIKNFVLSTDEIKVKLKQGESVLKSIIITNNGNQKLSISIENPKLKDFLKISEESFDLDVGESKSIVFDILAKEETIPDLYIGKLIIKGDVLEKEILVAIEVESKKTLFDVKVEIFERFMHVLPGEEVVAKIEIFNLGDFEKVDALIEYIIIDENENKIIYEQETKAIETSISFIKEFKIPENAKFGRYVLYVRVTHDEQTGSASTWFKISTRIPIITFILRNIIEIIISILALIIILLIIRIYKSKKEILRRRKEENLKYYKNLEEEKKNIVSVIKKEKRKTSDFFRDFFRE